MLSSVGDCLELSPALNLNLALAFKTRRIHPSHRESATQVVGFTAAVRRAGVDVGPSELVQAASFRDSFLGGMHNECCRRAEAGAITPGSFSAQESKSFRALKDIFAKWCLPTPRLLEREPPNDNLRPYKEATRTASHV